MKNNFFKSISMMTVALLMLSNVAVFAVDNSMNGMKNNINILEKQDKIYVKTGEISEVKNNTLKIGEKSSKYIFRITSETKITDEKDKSIDISELKAGMNVEVTYKKNGNSNSDKSSEAVYIKVINNLDETVKISDAVIEDIFVETNGNQIVTVVYETIDNKNRIIENEFNLVIDKNSKIVNKFGVNSTIAELKIGMTIDVEHSKATTKSYVPQAYAYTIEIVKEYQDSQILESKIIAKNVFNSVSYVLVGNPDKVSEQLLLVLSNKTKLKDSIGNDINFEDLTVGQTVVAEYSNMLTRSVPAQAQVYSLQVVDKIEEAYIEKAIIDEVDVKNSSVTVTYEEKLGSKLYKETIVLLIDKNTTIKNASGKTISLGDLKADMIVNVKHAQAVTMSLPPQTLAYSIEVLSSTDSSIENEFKEIYKLLDKLFTELGVSNWEEILNENKDDLDLDDDDDLEDMIEEIVELVLGDDYDEDDDMEDKVEDLIEKLIKEMKNDKGNTKVNNNKSNKRDDD